MRRVCIWYVCRLESLAIYTDTILICYFCFSFCMLRIVQVYIGEGAAWRIEAISLGKCFVYDKLRFVASEA